MVNQDAKDLKTNEFDIKEYFRTLKEDDKTKKDLAERKEKHLSSLELSN